MSHFSFFGAPQRLRLTPDDIEALHHICPARTFVKGEALYRYGESATHLHVIMQGHVNLVVPGPGYHDHVIGVFGEQDFIGELFLAPQARYVADAIVASERVMACPVNRDDYLQLAMRVPRFVVNFSEVLTSHLAACRQQLGVASYSVRVRLAHALLVEAAQFAAEDASGWVTLDRRLTHEDLAARISSTRVTVTQVMSALRGEGILEGARGQYRVNTAALRLVASSND